MKKDNRQKQLREWLAKKLKESGRGTKTALATHLGLRNEVISRMLKPSPERGYRVMRAEELTSMIDFFGEIPPRFNPALEENQSEREETVKKTRDQEIRTWLMSKLKEAGRGAQAALASFLGIRKEAVSRMINPSVSQGYRLIKAEELSKIIDFFGEVPPGFALPEMHSTNATIVGDVDFDDTMRIPVYGQAVGGLDGEFPMNGNALYDVLCPPRLHNVNGAYAVCVSGDSMYPRYRDGELAYVDPMRRVTKGDFVVAQVMVKEDDSVPQAFVKLFVRHNSEELVLEQFNPPKELRFLNECVVSVHYIALTGDRL